LYAEHLSPAQREILVATYVEGDTVAEAARLLAPLGSAKSRIFVRSRRCVRPSPKEA
jgi:DNA-directed RNA polymerase specialized sigma24 family protein